MRVPFLRRALPGIRGCALLPPTLHVHSSRRARLANPPPPPLIASPARASGPQVLEAQPEGPSGGGAQRTRRERPALPQLPHWRPH